MSLSAVVEPLVYDPLVYNLLVTINCNVGHMYGVWLIAIAMYDCIHGTLHLLGNSCNC